MALAMGFLTAALVATVVAATTSPTVGASATTTLTCTAALSAACQPEKSNGVFTCAQCAGVHQHELQAAGCSNDDIAAWCAGVTPHSRSQFPGSKLITSTDLAATLNGWASLDVLQEWVRCYSSFENASHPSAFHQGCDSYATTLIVARNGLNQTFGGYATRTWNKDACCRDPANHCVPMGSRCTQYDATSDFVFGLAPGKPVRYAPTPEAQTYQVVSDASKLVRVMLAAVSCESPTAAFLDACLAVGGRFTAIIGPSLEKVMLQLSTSAWTGSSDLWASVWRATPTLPALPAGRQLSTATCVAAIDHGALHRWKRGDHSRVSI